ncbi:hypothetical protein EVAR_25955_1 [Eumeta japonica]|uniref:Uncharacterized protein n=1 Tax=Eumeta variegata TaxID=151549 RepID=A0A4C1V2N6_EUMVA|nr:hypothetical protein EVAR_25955_1 [Eumeta japonica]
MRRLPVGVVLLTPSPKLHPGVNPKGLERGRNSPFHAMASPRRPLVKRKCESVLFFVQNTQNTFSVHNCTDDNNHKKQYNELFAVAFDLQKKMSAGRN